VSVVVELPLGSGGNGLDMLAAQNAAAAGREVVVVANGTVVAGAVVVVGRVVVVVDAVVLVVGGGAVEAVVLVPRARTGRVVSVASGLDDVVEEEAARWPRWEAAIAPHRTATATVTPTTEASEARNHGGKARHWSLNLPPPSPMVCMSNGPGCQAAAAGRHRPPKQRACPEQI